MATDKSVIEDVFSMVLMEQIASLVPRAKVSEVFTAIQKLMASQPVEELIRTIQEWERQDEAERDY